MSNVMIKRFLDLSLQYLVLDEAICEVSNFFQPSLELVPSFCHYGFLNQIDANLCFNS